MSNLQYVTQARGPAFVSGAGCERYAVVHQTLATVVTGQTSWVATTPTFLFNKTTANVARRLILSNLSLSQAGTVAGGAIEVAVMIDPTDRYASGGTAVVPQLTTTQQVTSGTTPEFAFRYNPTASAAGTVDSAPRTIFHQSFIAVTGTSLPTIDFQDEAVIQGPGSILVYTWAATTGPSWFFNFEVIEEGIRGNL